MRIKAIHYALILISIIPIKNICIQGGNCPEGQGFCNADSCTCLYNYWSLNTKANQSPTIYCNYKKYNRFFILLFEFFLPCFGHLIAGKYYFFIIKFLLLFFPILYFICGFFIYKNDDGSSNFNSKGWQQSGDENRLNNTIDEHLYRANRENVKINKWDKFLVILSFFSLIAFVLMHIVDIFCYAIGLYYDGNGVPFA